MEVFMIKGSIQRFVFFLIGFCFLSFTSCDSNGDSNGLSGGNGDSNGNGASGGTVISAKQLTLGVPSFETAEEDDLLVFYFTTNSTDTDYEIMLEDVVSAGVPFLAPYNPPLTYEELLAPAFGATVIPPQNSHFHDGLWRAYYKNLTVNTAYIFGIDCQDPEDFVVTVDIE